MKPSLGATVSSHRMDWRTPEWLLDIARSASPYRQIALDPCTTADNPTKAKRFYTPDDDGLSQDWTTDGVLWCNPPYGRGLSEWSHKWNRATAGAKFFLCPARVDQPWFWNLARYGEIWFLRKRVRFVGASAGAPFPNALVVDACGDMQSALGKHSVWSTSSDDARRYADE